jgi:hypothetical protein
MARLALGDIRAKMRSCLPPRFPRAIDRLGTIRRADPTRFENFTRARRSAGSISKLPVLTSITDEAP